MDTDAATEQELREHFPLFRNDPALLHDFVAAGQVIQLPRGHQIYWQGDACQGIAFLFSGGVRVYKCSESGREISLYEIVPGETCILNASCIIGRQGYPANAVTLADCRALFVPAASFRQLMARHETLRIFIYALLGQRLVEIMELVEEIAFRRMDDRLRDYLIEKSADGILRATHQTVANDLGTSREVVTRLLRDLEQRGEVHVSRNEISLLSGLLSN
ncbi:MAG: Crp/Fnr family transcriptional regulator [Geobacteraceae bacterium]|nr:Crp/Fnr family transcriptional regulator [Geobacteraceae bacterium]